MRDEPPIPPHRMDIPLPAVRFTDSRGAERHAVWCPWCESLHMHGAGAGHRAAGEHCHPHRGSPLGGYELKPVRKGGCEGDAIPKAPLAGKVLLARELSQKQRSLVRAVASVILNQKKAMDLPTGREIAGMRTWVRLETGIGGDAAAWSAYRKTVDEGSADGNDLVSLAAFLFGVTPGVAAVRILEATTGACLDADAALAVSHAIDQWHARGSPRGEGRRL